MLMIRQLAKFPKLKKVFIVCFMMITDETNLSEAF
jgi:hypothetical protein